MLSKGIFTPKSTRNYPLDSKEGIYQAMPLGTDAAYISQSGKLYAVQEDATPRELYPARELTELMYPIYASVLDSDTICIGEQVSGNMLSVDVATGTTTLLKSGTEPFSGDSRSYAPGQVLRMSMTDAQNFVGAVKDNSGSFDLLLSQNGQVTVVESLHPGVNGRLLNGLLAALCWWAVIFLAMQLIRGFLYMVSRGRTILLKLAFTAIPLVALALVFFGVFSYRSYERSIRQSFQKQVVDEGNMLTALFGTQSFEEIEFPYDYTSDAYSYLESQMKTRAIYTRTAYYDREQDSTGKPFPMNLYLVVGRDVPCSYPFAIGLNRKADELYEQAAFTGTAQSGVIRDQDGERLVCVTPIGSGTGDTVYLLETGILVGNMAMYTEAYLFSYLLVSLIFLIGIGVLLTVVFMRILRPIGQIKEGLEEFSQGNRSVRLENNTSDELSDIIRVFNKMAGDIDVQIYNLRQASEVYFRFIPRRLFRLLGKENLGELQLGTSMEQESHILCVNLKLPAERLSSKQIEGLINRFFGIVNSVCEEQGAVLLPDSVNLMSLKILFPDGGDSAVSAALSILSGIDSANASMMLQSRMDVLCVVHKSKVYYGICGEENRLVPTLLSGEIDYLNGQTEFFRQLSSRLVVTSAAYGDVEESSYFHRFIGYPQGCEDPRYGLYDFYDSSTPEEIRLINETRGTFDKAMELYREKRYYDAKNLFAVVLRENQYDNVSRYYIFSCEKHL